MTREEQAVRLALIAWLTRELKKADTTERTAVDWPEETRIPAQLPDGTTIATVTMAKGAGKVKVYDDAKFTQWVRENRPDQLETRVRPAYVRDILEREGGELPPGVELVVGDPHPVVLLKKDAADAIAGAWRGGDLYRSLPELGETP